MKKKTITATNKKTNAIDMLESQHREVERLFEDFTTATENDEDSEQASEIAMLVCGKLTLHATIEEELFYPALQGEETEDILAESAVEHMSAKRLISDIATVGNDATRLKALMTVLQEQIEHHVQEEEQTLFPQAQEILSAEELVELAPQMQERFDELKAQGVGNIQAAGQVESDEDEDEDEGQNLAEDESEITAAAPNKNAAHARKSL